MWEKESETALLFAAATAEAQDCSTYPVRDQSGGSTRYAWIGAGRCGGRLVKSFYDLGYRSVLALDTAGRDLDLLDLPRNQKFLIGDGQQQQSPTDPEQVTHILKQHRQNILHFARQTFATQVDRIMVCCGAGGSTGSGSVIELIEIAKKYARHIGIKNPNKKVGVIMTLPDSDEVRSARVARNAHSVAAALCQMATAEGMSPLILVDNQKIGEIRPGTTRPSYWASMNGTVASLFDVFNRLSALSSPYTCFDPADYDSIMSAGGCLIMGAAGVGRLDDTFGVSKAVEHSLQTTLLAGGENLPTAKVAGCVVVGGHELMAHIKGLQDNIDYAFDVLGEVPDRAVSYRGIYEDDRDGLAVYTIIAGLDPPTAWLKEMDIELCPEPESAEPAQKPQDQILSSAECFLAEQADAHGGRIKTLSPDTKTLLVNYCWPEDGLSLAEAIQHAYKATEGSRIPPQALPFEIIFAETERYGEPALPILDKVKLRMAGTAYDEFLRSLEA